MMSTNATQIWLADVSMGSALVGGVLVDVAGSKCPGTTVAAGPCGGLMGWMC